MNQELLFKPAQELHLEQSKAQNFKSKVNDLHQKSWNSVKTDVNNLIHNIKYGHQNSQLGIMGGNPFTTFGTSVVGGWKELGRTTLGAVNDSISVSVADKRYYMILANFLDSGNISPRVRLNGDSGANYSARFSEDGGGDTTLTSQGRMTLDSRTTALEGLSVGYLANYSTKEKLLLGHTVRKSASGATTAPVRAEAVGKHAQTTNPITSIELFNPETGDYAIGSELVVLGWSPTDIHTTNAWEQLASVDLSGGAASTLSTPTFTAKKYLWIQIYASDNAGSTINPEFRVNSDSGSNYARRKSVNGGADSTNVSQTEITTRITQSSSPSFMNFFVINNASNEKLFTGHTIERNTVGATAAPQRTEEATKWANTSSQITSIQLFQNSGISSNLFGVETAIKVWGFN